MHQEYAVVIYIITIVIMYIVAFYSNILIFFLTSPTLIRISLPLPLPFVCSHKNLQPNTTYIQTQILSNCHHHQNMLQQQKSTQNQTINGKPIIQTQTQNQNQTQWRKRDFRGKRDISINGKPTSPNPNLVEREIWEEKEC